MSASSSAKKTKGARPALTPFLPLSIVRSLWKRKVWIVAGWLAFSAAVVIGVALLPAQYRAESLILVESQKIPESLVASTVNSELQDRLATISQQILSSTRLQAIIDKFQLYSSERQKLTREELIENMRADIKIKLEKGWTRNQPGAFRISYTSANPELAATVTNQIASLFIEENLRSRENQAAGTSQFLETQLQQAKKSLEEQEQKISVYKQQHSGQLPEQENALLGHLERLRTELQGNQEAVSRAQSNISLLRGALSAADLSLQSAIRASEPVTQQIPGSRGGSSSAGYSGPAVVRHSEQLREQWLALKSRYTDLHPAVREARAALDRALAEEAAATARAEAAPKPSPEKEDGKGGDLIVKTQNPELVRLVAAERERVTNLRSQLDVAVKELAGRQQEQARIQAAINAQQGQVEKLPLRQQEMTSLLRDYEMSKDHYKSLLNKNYAADIASDMEKGQKAERFTVLDPARPPEKPTKPNRILLDSAGVILGLLLAMGVAFGLEWRKGLILGDWELPSEIPVLGRIPALAGSGAGYGGDPGASRFSFLRRKRFPPKEIVTSLLVIATFLSMQ